MGSASKFSTTVRAHMLHILGLIAESFPGDMSGKDPSILSIYLSTLKSQMIENANRKPDMPLIAGFVFLVKMWNDFFI